jgi:hypothetical protein
MKNRLDKWSAEIDKMDAKARETGEGTKLAFQDQIARLRASRAEANQKIEAVSQAGETAWKELRTGVNTSWKTLRKAMRTAMANFKDPPPPRANV